MSGLEEKLGAKALRETMAVADVLDVFLSLPEPTRARFEGWIERARDAQSQWQRIEALVLAMRISPLVDPTDSSDSQPESEAL